MKTTAIAFDDDPRTGRVRARLGLVSELFDAVHEMQVAPDRERILEGVEQIVEDCLLDLRPSNAGGAR